MSNSGAKPIRVDDFHRKVENRMSGNSGSFGIRPVSTSSPQIFREPPRDLGNKSGMYLDTDEDDELRTNK